MTQLNATLRSVLQLAALGLAACCPAQVPTTPAPPLAESAVAPASSPASLDVTAAPPAKPEADPVAVAVAAPDRTEADRALDAGRKPEALLRFFQIAEGMKVAELAAGGGYTAELLARIVGPTGKVYGQNSKFILDRFAQGPWTERLQRPVNANVVRLDREFDAPLPPDVQDLDAVLFVLFYHDTVWLKTDRAQMNRAIFAALKPGGVYGVVDHRAQLGQALSQVETLHRIEESVVRAEIEAAGFVLDAEASFLENPADTKDWSASPRTAGELRGTSDRFVLRYRKPLTTSP
jgi:predicted methyltransferase